MNEFTLNVKEKPHYEFVCKIYKMDFKIKLATERRTLHSQHEHFILP